MVQAFQFMDQKTNKYLDEEVSQSIQEAIMCLNGQSSAIYNKMNTAETGPDSNVVTCSLRSSHNYLLTKGILSTYDCKAKIRQSALQLADISSVTSVLNLNCLNLIYVEATCH